MSKVQPIAKPKLKEYIVIPVLEGGGCPECGWEIAGKEGAGHHPNCPIGRLDHELRKL